METKYFIASFIICMILPASAQGQNIICGMVKNVEGANLDAVCITLLSAKDSVEIRTTYSDEKGQYRLEGISNGRFIVKASPIFTKPAYKNVVLLGNSEMEVNFVVEETIQLDELVVKSTGVTISGDTTSYAVTQFTTGDERNLKDVLEKLPSIRVDALSNAITAKGKPVRRVLLENQDLFQGNTSVPLNNMSSEGILRIEVIDNYSEFDIYNGFSSTDETVMNVKVNDKMHNAPHGNADINAGVMNKYNVKGYATLIGRKTMLSALLSANNIGDQLMSFQDVVTANGGYNTLLSSDDPLEHIQSVMKDFSPFMDSRKDFKRRGNGLLSLSMITQPSKSLKISASYIGNIESRHSSSSQQYSFLSGLEYNELNDENADNKNSLAKLSLHFTPSNDFNVHYAGSMAYADHHTINNGYISSSRLDYKSKNRLMNFRNNAKVIKRISDNLLTLSIDYNSNSLKNNLDFGSDSLFYAGWFGLDKAYVFDNDIRKTEIGAELFYLQRLNDDYFFRVGIRSSNERQTLSTDLRQTTDNEKYNEGKQLTYFTNDAALKFGKDRGRFKFNTAVKVIFSKASSNLRSPLSEREAWRLLPSLNAKYSFSQTHNLTLDHSLNLRKNNLQEVADGYLISAYNTINTGKGVDRLFCLANRTSLTHVLMMPFIGLTLVNMATLEIVNNALTYNHVQMGNIGIFEKRVGGRQHNLMIMPSVEYRFLYFPLNVNLQFGVMHSSMPFYEMNELHDAKSIKKTINLKLSTRYKKGLNSIATADVEWNGYRGVPIENKTKIANVSWMLSWRNNKLFVSSGVKYQHFRLNKENENAVSVDAEMKYDLSSKCSLSITASDVAHLSKRIKTNGIIDTYYAVTKTMWYMPGHILCGIIYKF